MGCKITAVQLLENYVTKCSKFYAYPSRITRDSFKPALLFAFCFYFSKIAIVL